MNQHVFFCLLILLSAIQAQVNAKNFGPQCDALPSPDEKTNCSLSTGKIGICAEECLIPKDELAEPCCYYKGEREFRVFYCCELDLDFAVVGGEQTQPNEFPYMVALGWYTIDKIYKYDYKCGGVFISQKFVLTAAHCAYVDGEEPNVVLPGGNSLAIDDILVKYTIERVIVHPYYNEDEAYNDIALIEIVGEANDTEYVASIDLWRRPYIANTTFTAIGYGDTNYGGTSTNELLKVTLQHVTFNKCQEFYRFEDNVPSGIIATQLCAQDPKNIMDTCQGDSGGPLVMSVYNNNRDQKKEYIVGITSFGQGCALNSPGVYTRVSSYIEWIDNVMRPVQVNNTNIRLDCEPYVWTY